MNIMLVGGPKKRKKLFVHGTTTHLNDLKSSQRPLDSVDHLSSAGESLRRVKAGDEDRELWSSNGLFNAHQRCSTTTYGSISRLGFKTIQPSIGPIDMLSSG